LGLVYAKTTLKRICDKQDVRLRSAAQDEVNRRALVISDNKFSDPINGIKYLSQQGDNQLLGMDYILNGNFCIPVLKTVYSPVVSIYPTCFISL
jgi:hypothetical protein